MKAHVVKEAIIENANSLLVEEYSALKTEMLLRISIQNLTILTTVILYLPTALLIVIFPSFSAALAFVYGVANLALALQWCHQGVRQCALKQAVLSRDKEAGRGSSWEIWLPSQRPNNILGSRWFISTKLVFIGLNLSTLFLSLTDFGFLFLLAIAMLLITTVSLLTNPKE